MQWSDFIGFHHGVRSHLTKWNVTKWWFSTFDFTYWTSKFLYSVTAFYVPANTLYCSLNCISKICWLDLKFFCPTSAQDIREKNHIYSLLQMPICTMWPSFPLTCRSLFILTIQILAGSRLLHPQNHFGKFLSAPFFQSFMLNYHCCPHFRKCVRVKSPLMTGVEQASC